MKIYFPEVKIQGIKQGTCKVCGKKGKRTENFVQTINPYNLTEDGRTKTSFMILEELQLERTEWMKLPFVHKNCESDE